MKDQVLLGHAKKAMKNAYAPYSKYKVGAALLTKSGKVFTGCNIENNSYGLTICAERVAVFNAVSEGERKFKMMAIISSDSKLAMPCGACLQVMVEFTHKMPLIIGNNKGKIIKRDLSTLIPEPFGK